MHLYISDIIKDDFKNWKPGSMVYVNSSTGAGKTTFILQKLLPYAIEQNREILFLSNRISLQQQVLTDVCPLFDIASDYFENTNIREFPGITLMSYQSLQKILEEKGSDGIDFFYYIVADEVHYIVEDSEFSPKIKFLLDWLPKARCAVMLAMSATIDEALPYLDKNPEDWYVSTKEEFKTVFCRQSSKIAKRISGESDYLYWYKFTTVQQDYQIIAFETADEIVELINQDESEEKWLVFQGNIEKAKKNFEDQLTCGCICLTADDKENGIMTEVVKNKCFSEKVLITTKVLDNGVSLCDSRITNIVLEANSETEFIQMLGRRRIFPNEDVTLNLYLPIKKSSYFETLLRMQIYPALEYMRFPANELLQKVYDSLTVHRICMNYFFLQDGKLVLNPAAKVQLLAKRKFCEEMADALRSDPFAFLKKQLQWLKWEGNFADITFIREKRREERRTGLTEYVKSLQDKEMSKTEQQEFRTQIRGFLLEIKPGTIKKTVLPGLKVINEAFENLEIKCQVISCPGKRKGEETKWKVILN